MGQSTDNVGKAYRPGKEPIRGNDPSKGLDQGAGKKRQRRYIPGEEVLHEAEELEDEIEVSLPGTTQARVERTVNDNSNDQVSNNNNTRSR